MTCENARALVPSYLDGELSEEQAAPLRSHLFDCPACRETAKAGKALKRWFVTAPFELPSGFAARVARRAFAGDPGSEGHPSDESPYKLPRPRGTTLPFVLKLATLAAGILLAFSFALRMRSLPAGDGLEAQDYRAPWEKEALERALHRAATGAEALSAGTDEPLETPGKEATVAPIDEERR